MIAPCENREGFMMLGNAYYCWVHDWTAAGHEINGVDSGGRPNQD
jgi:hypothetical protein